MGSGVSAPLSAAQLQGGTYTNEELRTALQGLESADLCRFLKLVGCHTLRMGRAKLITHVATHVRYEGQSGHGVCLLLCEGKSRKGAKM